MTVTKASGAQKIVCSMKERSGSAAKNQPPMLSERDARAETGCRGRPLILLEGGIAAQALPGKAGYFCPLNPIIKLGRRPPVGF
jgi:hypothetical protein